MPAANTKPYQIVAGVADVYVAPVGTSPPAIGSAPGSPWIYLGHTDGGVEAQHSQTVVELMTDQVTAPLKGVRSAEGLNLVFALAEATLENYSKVLNQAIEGPATDGNDLTVSLYRGGFGVETVAMLVRGEHLSPYGDFNTQYEVPAVYQSGSPATKYTKDAKVLLACTWTAIAANAFDNDVADEDIFGILRAQAQG